MYFRDFFFPWIRYVKMQNIWLHVVNVCEVLLENSISKDIYMKTQYYSFFAQFSSPLLQEFNNLWSALMQVVAENILFSKQKWQE